MNRSNFQYPPDPQNCCCRCPRNEHSPRGGRAAKYAESSPNEDDEDENRCNVRGTKSTGGHSSSPDEIYDHLIDLIDDQMISTMSTLRKKARKFMKSEFESLSSDTTSHPCPCSGDFRGRGTKVVKRANEIDYQPQSAFLKKMVVQYQGKPCYSSENDEMDFPKSVEKRKKTKKKKKSDDKPKVPTTADQKEQYTNPYNCKYQDVRGAEKMNKQQTQKKSEHMSRSKKKNKYRGKRRQRSDKCPSGGSFEPQLKQPHENSCERCWRFASPSRSPVNKPDQRYDPNFRRGHSCSTLDLAKEDLIDEKGNHISPRKNLEPIPVNKKFTASIPEISTRGKSVQTQDVVYENYSPQYTPFSEHRKLPCRPQTYDPSQPPYTDVKELEFEYPPPPETARTLQQKCITRPHTCEKTKKRAPFETGIIYPGIEPSRMTKPQSFTSGPCMKETSAVTSIPYQDVCGRERPENLDPSIRRSPANKMPSQGAEMSVLRGNSSKGSGFGAGLSTSRTGALDSGRKSSEKSPVNEKSVVREMSIQQAEERNGSDAANVNKSLSIQRAFVTSTPKELDEVKEKEQKKKPSQLKPPKIIITSPKTNSPKTKSPKSKSPAKTPNLLQSPRTAKGKEKKTGSINEAGAYFEVPGKPKPPEKCGESHPIRNCECFPRVERGDTSGIQYCCHCSRKEKPKNESGSGGSSSAGGPPPNRECCSPRPSTSAPSTSQGHRLSPTSNYNQGRYGPTLPNIDEYPEQFSDNFGADFSGEVVPCPYRMFMNSRLLNSTASPNDPRCERSNTIPRNENYNITNLSRNGNVFHESGKICSGNAFASPMNRNANAFYRNGNANGPGLNENLNAPYGNVNASYRNGNENVCPRYGDFSYGGYSMAPQMNAYYGMEYPRKYCVMYMTKGKENTGDDVEVLVEELTQPCPYDKDGRMMDVTEKMTRVFKCPAESMALRFQKGVSDGCKAPQKSRVLYF